MQKNNILDYEQVESILQKINQNGIIKQIEDIGRTKYGLPIKHYVAGSGKQDIVITGATHGSEIISTDFVIKVMQKISYETNNWKSILKNFRIHFIPVLNPEGYLIVTSAIRKLIPRDMKQDEAEKICKQYYLQYRQDDISQMETKEGKKVKRHQEMFEGIDYTCIPKEYEGIRNSVKTIFEKYTDLPKWCLHIWSANASGIDIQANSIYNPKIKNILQNETLYMKTLRHNNIDISHPGPINCPFDKERGFEIQKETKAISDLLQDLDKQGKLFAYLNYHATGGLVFQRPAIVPENIQIFDDEILKKEITNYMFAKAYSDKTYKNTGIDEDEIDKRQKTKYIIKTQKSPATSSNDIFRIMYPKDMLIELSGMGGNPIGPYGDIKGNYTNAMESNLSAVNYILTVANIAQIISEESYNVIKKLQNNQDYDKLVQVQDIIYKEFSEKVQQLEKIHKCNEREDSQGYDRDE